MKEAKAQERKDRLLTRGEQIVGQLVPTLIDNMKAQKPIQEFLGSLDDEQAVQIMSTLRPDQLQKLGKLLESKEQPKEGEKGNGKSKG
jgi:hypothetical protein